MSMVGSSSTTAVTPFPVQLSKFSPSSGALRSFTSANWFFSNPPSLSSCSCKASAGSGSNVLEAKPNMVEGIGEALEGNDSDEFVEVGLIRNTHGIRGEVKVTSRTDFPEQRFEKPGSRWVGYFRYGKLVGIHEIELLRGRKIIQGKELAWLLTFGGFDTLEKASKLVGAAVLVKNADRPLLSSDQFYIPDLIGMSVQLKETGEVIGSIVDIFKSGASDLLRVKLSELCENVGGRKDDRLVWIPFVEEIVPVVDQQARMVQIFPPQGLLELNLPSKRPLKEELRKQALKSKRKLQERMSGVRKKVLALKQDHILSGLTLAGELQREALKKQLLDIDFSSFKRAMETSLKDSELSLYSHAFAFTSAIASSLDWKGLKGWLEASNELGHDNKLNKLTKRSWLRGLDLVAKDKVAVVALPTEALAGSDVTDEFLESSLESQAGQLLALQELAKMILGEMPTIPWVVVTTENSAEHIENLLKDEAYFGLSEGQVHFVKLSCLPLINPDAEDGVHKVLMESESRISTGAGGDGQVISDLDDSGVLNALMEKGISYIHLCSLMSSPAINMDPAIFGLMEEGKACVALKITREAVEGDHGILCLQKGCVDSRNRRSIFISTSDEAVEISKENAATFEHYTVVKRLDSTEAALPALKDDELIYRVPSNSTCTLSTEYLKHLSLQRHSFIYEAEVKSLSNREWSEGRDIENEPPKQRDAIQFKCPLHNSLLFCSPSKVALLEYEAVV